MSSKNTNPKDHNLIDEVNNVADHINRVLDRKAKTRYFESIALLHGFMEDLLKWLVFVQVVWNKSEKGAGPQGETHQIRLFCNQLNFSQLLNTGLCVGLLPYSLFRKLDEVRLERNHIVHQYWLYVHKGKRRILRKKLEKLALIANTLVSKLNHLVEETGIDETYGLFDLRSGRKLLGP